MKNFLLIFLLLFTPNFAKQDYKTSDSCCINNSNSIQIKSTDGESKLSFCFDGQEDYLVITQRFEFKKQPSNYRVKIRDNSPLFMVDQNKRVVKTKLDKLQYYNNDYASDYLECQYFYPITKFNMNALLLNPISFIFMYRDDRVEMFELEPEDQIKLYELVKEFYVYKDWKLKLD